MSSAERARASGRALGIGIVGLGRAGRSVLPAIEKHPGLRLAAIAEPLADVREHLAAEYGAIPCPDIEALVKRPEVDVVYVATPTDLHVEHVVTAARAGKHVLCEKPMAIDLAGAQQMIDAAEAAGVRLLIGHSHSYDLPTGRCARSSPAGRSGACGSCTTSTTPTGSTARGVRRSCKASWAEGSRSGKARTSSTSCGCSAAGW